ncbi:hypothetical protein [Caminibacter pacificus]
MKILIDNIIDIRINKNQMYFLKKHSWNSKTIEQEISNLDYNGEKRVKDDKVENAYLPPFIIAFYMYLFEKTKIPKEQELFKLYLDLFYDHINENNVKIKQKYIDVYTNNIFSKEGVLTRLLRSYPSLIRDFHFLILCFESNLFDKSYYSLNIDYFDGYDIIVKYSGCTFGVSLHINSSRGNYYKNKKRYRHTYNNLHEIVIKATKEECVEYGTIRLFTTKHVKQLKIKITEYLDNEKKQV